MAERLSERRAQERTGISCPFTLAGGQGETVVKATSINISDGGALISAPADGVPDSGADVHIRFAVPRTTANTRMLEEFVCTGRVVRHQRLEDNAQVGVALKFSRPLKLALEV